MEIVPTWLCLRFWDFTPRFSPSNCQLHVVEELTHVKLNQPTYFCDDVTVLRVNASQGSYSPTMLEGLIHLIVAEHEHVLISHEELETVDT